MKCLLLLALQILSLSLVQNSKILSDFTSGYNRFTADVYKEMLQGIPGSFIVSPLAAHIILAFTESGAQGQTAKEISAALRTPEKREQIHQMFTAITPYLQSIGNYTLSSANKIYLSNKYKLNHWYRKAASDFFDTDIESIDFSKNIEAAEKINRWVKYRTFDKILNLIAPTRINSDTCAILVNAIYFHGQWVKGFDKLLTTKLSFYLNKKDYIRTDMMVANDNYEYYEHSELDAKFLKLDYKGGDVSMHIVLPNEKDGLTTLEARMSDVLVPPKYYTRRVSVRIPKFKMETGINLKPILQSMGIMRVFSNSGDLRGIAAEQEDLKISEIVQKAFIEVEENGTSIASAATVAVWSVIGIPVQLKQFHADHPFLFYLRLNKLGINFFVGRYASPSEESSCSNALHCVVKGVTGILFSRKRHFK